MIGRYSEKEKYVTDVYQNIHHMVEACLTLHVESNCDPHPCASLQ